MILTSELRVTMGVNGFYLNSDKIIVVKFILVYIYIYIYIYITLDRPMQRWVATSHGQSTEIKLCTNINLWKQHFQLFAITSVWTVQIWWKEDIDLCVLHFGALLLGNIFERQLKVVNHFCETPHPRCLTDSSVRVFNRNVFLRNFWNI